jgi:hypothetical protein
MAISLGNKPNIDAPTSDYPYGDIRDDSGSNDGTPVSKQVYADFHQFFARLLALSGLTPNELPDNATNTFQLYDALLASTSRYRTVSQSTVSLAVGTRTFSVQVNMDYVPGMILWCKCSNGVMYGPVTSYDATTGILVVSVQSAIGVAGNYAVWQINLGRLTPATDAQVLTGTDTYGYINSAALAATPSVLHVDGSAKISTKIITIGNWNMQSTATVALAHGLDYTKIRGVQTMIFKDGGNFAVPLYDAGGAIPVEFDATDVYLSRSSGQFFDTADYSGTSANRGYVTIMYEA